MYFYFPICLTVVANILYHLCLKGTNSKLHPLVSLAFSYTVSVMVCLSILPFLKIENWKAQMQELTWATFALGVPIVILEVGFLLAYRVGWRINTAALYSNILVGIILLPVGAFFFKESFSVTKLAGVVVSLLGLYLLGKD